MWPSAHASCTIGATRLRSEVRAAVPALPVRNLGKLRYSYSVRISSIVPRYLLSTLVAWFAVSSAFGQPTAEPTKATAIKLPDGTVVFWTKNPDEANPAVDGVVLSTQDYKTLVDQAEQARKAKSQTPSSLAIRGKIETRGERLVAALTLTYSFRTTQPRTLLILGCQRALLVGAKTGQAKLPILNPPGDDGLTLLVDNPGEQTLTLDVEVPVVSRGPKNELGFEIGLPRAAITTLKLDAAPAAGIKAVAVGTRIPEAPALLPAKPDELKRFASPVDQLIAKPVPLGATDVLELTWEPISPALAPAAALPTVESATVVRVEDGQIETVAKLRLRGNLKEWPLQLPVGADVTVERIAIASGGPIPSPEPMPPTVVRPNDPNKSVWVIRTPGDSPAVEWLVTATVRTQRPKPNEPKFRGPYPVGPFQLLANAKQLGRFDVYAGPSVRLSFRPSPEFRRQDLPAAAPEDHIAHFTYGGLPTVSPTARAGAWVELDARVAPTAIRSKATHKLRLTAGGWRLESSVRITPPPRGELEQIAVEIPAEWTTLEGAPEELVESVQILKEGSPRLVAIRFHTPQKSAFTLKLLSMRPLPAPVPGASDDREAKLTLTLPRFSQADEREAGLTASVPDGYEVRGSVSLWEGGQPSPASDPLIAAGPANNRPGAIGTVEGTFDHAIARVELHWQPYRPVLICDNRVDVTLQPRQLLVQQAMKFKPSQDDRRPIRLRGPEGLVGLQSVPALDPVGPGVWEFRSNAEPGKEFNLSVAFGLRLAATAPSTVSLLWPEAATRTESILRVWGGATGRRIDKLEGDWRELPNEGLPDRDMLPLLTLAASKPAAALGFELSDPGESGLPTVWIERAFAGATLGETHVVLHEKLLLKKWLGSSMMVELPRLEHLELWVDGKPVEAVPKSTMDDGSDSSLLTVPLPEYKSLKVIAVELRYRYASARNRQRERQCVPPRIRGAVYRTALRWWIATEAESVAFIPSGHWDPEYRWAWRGFGFAPTARETPQELDAWLIGGLETEADESAWRGAGGSDAISGRQTEPKPISVVLIPKLGWIAGCSGLLFLFGIAMSYLRTVLLGLVLGTVGIGLAFAGALCPQALAQTLSAMQAGAVLLMVALVGSAAWRFYRSRRLDRLPGFSRDRTATSVRGPEVPPASHESGKRPSRAPSSALPLKRAGSTAPPLAAGS